MAIVILEEKVCREVDGESTLYNKLENTDLKVLTGATWLYDMFDGAWNGKKTAVLYPVLDANDVHILGINLLADPNWTAGLDNEFVNPDTGALTTARKELIEINYVYWEQVLVDDTPVSCTI
jgi:hypothetical protein